MRVVHVYTHACEHVHTEARGQCHFLDYLPSFFETRSLPEAGLFGLDWLANMVLGLTYLPAFPDAPLCTGTWALGIQTQVLVLEQQVLFPVAISQSL